jgi:hypothetical protein
VDAGPTLTNPVQISVSSLFNANTVVTTTSGGVPLTPVDGTDSFENDDFPTQSEAARLSSTATGLPDNAFFATNGTSIPDVQLAWNNSSNVENSLVVLASAGTGYTFSVPPAAYSQLQIYATGGNGSSTLTVTLTYSDNTTATSSVAVPDWCSSAALGAGQYKLVSAVRVQNGALNAQNPDLACSIYALNLDPSPAKALTSVAFSDSGSSVSYFAFYGAVAW